jgi:hypothetical protein
MANGDLKDEYLDASANQRQFQTLRFAQITVFIAITGFLINLLFNASIPVPTLERLALKTGGLLVTFLFWIHQERVMAYWNHFVQRAAELEKELGFRQYSTRPRAGIVSSFKAMRLFFIVFALFWTVALVWLT